ncbi:hypothetical protein H7849_14860 [Alloacidobacterium dinghuense]|uniref:Uncharacterized protein n=1 Tax=Alloacidobacterium dinghuense TaxID=2763107 RepID=A0A7G8BD14_9BACT|nr:hypothetical protein [Alloacidobacterium dinghuense]QNI30434.1 hypothetical protein H7849_14860 [Alloacidobacterium dinghuense]
MFLSLNSVLLQGRVPWPDFARLAAKIGFPGTDIMLSPAMQAGVTATNDLLCGLKIKPAVIDFPVEFRKDDATFNASLTRIDAAAQFAAAIRCPRMITYIMPSSDTPKDELRQPISSGLQKVPAFWRVTTSPRPRVSRSARIPQSAQIRIHLAHERYARVHQGMWPQRRIATRFLTLAPRRSIGSCVPSGSAWTSILAIRRHSRG